MDRAGKKSAFIFRILAGLAAAVACLWVAFNAMWHTKEVQPGETTAEILRSLLLGRPGGSLCSQAVHAGYSATGPDGREYPTWHPPYDRDSGCWFNHEHGSDPRSYVGFPASGWPLFGYTSAQARIEEPHSGYKVFVTNDDLHGHAWMILVNQDTGDPGRARTQFHTVDWHISSLRGEALVDLHVMGDFGFAIQNCGYAEPIPDTEQQVRYTDSGHPRRIVLTTNCAAEMVYEKWEGSVRVGEAFQAKPLFDVDNPITAVDPNDLSAYHPTCQFRPIDEGCNVSGDLWNGNKRSVIHPGQRVRNAGPEEFYTSPLGDPVEAGAPHAIQQFVTRNGWDTRQCCGNEVVFRIQSFSDGVYIANPREPAGMVEFGVGNH